MAATTPRFVPSIRHQLLTFPRRSCAYSPLNQGCSLTRPLYAAQHKSFRSTMETPGLPIIVCGRREEIGRVVADSLRPDYEVVHFVKTPEGGVTELPLVLQGITPGSVTSNVGSGNVVNGAKAVVLGGGYDDDNYQVMREAVEKARLPRVPVWLRCDLNIPAPPPGPEYGKAVVGRVKEMLAKLDKEGKLDGADDGLYWY